ncbi:MAG TPA: hypothetical protein DDZ89_13780 [Clostridiales bacterium]|nr:hypothetical protein [Clostridiales bacterium]
MEEKFYSLLYPDEHSRETQVSIPKYITENIGFNDVKEWFYNTVRYKERHKQQLDQLLTEGHSIRYRQDILSDITSSAGLQEAIRQFLPRLYRLRTQFNEYIIGINDRTSDALWKVDLYECYASCMKELVDILTTHQHICSEGLLLLRKYGFEMINNSTYMNGISALSRVRRLMDEIRFVSVDVQVNSLFEPNRAKMSIKKQERNKLGLLCELFSAEQEKNHEHFSVKSHPVIGIQAIYNEKYKKQIEDILQAADPVLRAYNRSDIEKMLELDFELDFYLSAVCFNNRIKDMGIEMCVPVICSDEDNVCVVEKAVDLGLVVRISKEEKINPKIISNKICLDDSARIYVLTGANGGGKTTYLRSIGIVFMLFQNGLYVPGSHGRISPIQHLFIHFPQEEEKVAGEGRLGEELVALRKILDQAVSGDVILLNESLSGTSMAESMMICADFLRILSELGVKCVFATHLHVLADCLEEMNCYENVVSRMDSLTAVVEEIRCNDKVTERKRTYKIERRKPEGESYADDIAYAHGISYEQIMLTRKERGNINVL